MAFPLAPLGPAPQQRAGSNFQKNIKDGSMITGDEQNHIQPLQGIFSQPSPYLGSQPASVSPLVHSQDGPRPQASVDIFPLTLVRSPSGFDLFRIIGLPQY